MRFSKIPYRRGIVVAAITVALAAVVAIWWLTLNKHKDFDWNPEPNNIYTDTIVAAADMDYPPFSFIDESGVYSGHDAELIYAVADELRVNVDFRLLPWGEAKQQLLDGEVDVLMGMTYNPSRLDEYDFTSPIIYEPYVAFGREAEDVTPRSMIGKRLCTLDGDGIYEAFLVPYSFHEQTSFYATYTEAFQSVADGENDYVIAPYTTGVQIIDELDLSGVAAGGPELNNSIFCMGVKKGNSELLDRLNTALIALEQRGTLDTIYDHWLVRYVQPTSIGDIIANSRETFIIALLLLCVLLLLFFYILERYKIKNQKLTEQRQWYKNITEQALHTIARTIDAKDFYTHGHSERVAGYATEIGRRLGLVTEEVEDLYYAGLLHDIGKIGVPDSILNKPARLTDEEYETVKRHPRVGGSILQDFTTIDHIAESAKYHHERYDGRGYGEGLKGEDIPLFARIICVADAFDAMSSPRIYRPCLGREEIISELNQGFDTQFDARLAKIMLDMIDEGVTPV